MVSHSEKMGETNLERKPVVFKLLKVALASTDIDKEEMRTEHGTKCADKIFITMDWIWSE